MDMTPDFNLAISPTYLLPLHVKEQRHTMYEWYVSHFTRTPHG